MLVYSVLGCTIVFIVLSSDPENNDAHDACKSLFEILQIFEMEN